MLITAPIICRDAATYAPVTTLIPVPGAGVDIVTEATENEVVFRTRITPTAFINYELTQVVPGNLAPWPMVSKTPSICTVDGGMVLRTSAGMGVVRLTGPSGTVIEMEIEFPPVPYTSKKIWHAMTPDTKSARLSDPILGLLSLGKSTAYYLAGLGGTFANALKNPNCWATSLDLTGSAMGTSLGGSYGTANSGALVTPRHWLGVKHFGEGPANMGVGATVWFTDASGVIHGRTVLARYVHPTKDLILCLFNADLPPGCKPFKLAGAGHRDVGTLRKYGLGWQMTQEKNVTPVAFDKLDLYLPAHATSGEFVYWTSQFESITDSNHRLNGLGGLTQEGRIGDSGGAVGGFYNGETFLVSLFQGAKDGQYLPGMIPELNGIIATLDAGQGISTGYTVGVLEII
jgi:hypothetical protein